MELKVGDEIRFDHFGGVDRLGKVVKITKGAVHVEWMSPSSGIVRVVKLSTKPNPYDTIKASEFDTKNVRVVGARS